MFVKLHLLATPFFYQVLAWIDSVAFLIMYRAVKNVQIKLR